MINGEVATDSVAAIEHRLEVRLGTVVVDGSVSTLKRFR